MCLNVQALSKMIPHIMGDSILKWL